MDYHFRERAGAFGLSYVDVHQLCFKRRKSGRGFTYLDSQGNVIRDPEVRARLEALVLPPAWTDVCLADDPRAHVQAIGRDSEGRLQYRYHDDWTSVRDQIKAERLLRFGRALPKIRARLERDLRRRKTDRRYASAVAGRLIDRALLRSGHDITNIDDGGRGATTLLKRDVRITASAVELRFTGKSGKKIEKTVRDPLLVKRMSKLKTIGKKRLFAFKDEGGGAAHYLSARDLNAYLQEAAGAPVTAKDFRTFAASSTALAMLADAPPPESEYQKKRLLAKVMKSASERLANTPAVARASYVHPMVVAAFDEGRLSPAMLKGQLRQGLDRAETALMRFLESEVEAAARDAKAAAASDKTKTSHPERPAKAGVVEPTSMTEMHA
ncbi:DNA topoisomerase-1 [Faunimonas pinastri]|uniref:DNA topoisomerase n=1 Tax=Faunimonas pinastri TaxID=1855383 RepID=A0A1H9FDD7_9HYPH|nr:DNA topoisomerase IB [Faunimonas pinastri]SEQ35934.1 DNA topoisomerase-1 [Faunimonas pinastri]